MHELHANGHDEKKAIPAIVIGWDADAQQIHFQFDAQDFKTWDMMIGVLTMAIEHCKTQRQVTIAQNMQRAQIEAAHAEAIRRQLRG